MQEINHKKGKIYYSMGEVAEMFDVNPSLLRYWEQEFDILKPHRNKKGNRLFTPKDVDNIRIIYHLLKERKMKIEVARKYIRDYRKEVDRDAEITEHLMNIRAILLEIKQDLPTAGSGGRRLRRRAVAVPQQSGRETVGKGDEAGKERTAGTKTRNGRQADRPVLPNLPRSDRGDPGESGESGETGPCHGGYQAALRGTGTLRGGRSAGTDAGGKNGDDDGFESARAAFAGETAGEETPQEEEPKPRVQAIEQTLF